ncbi:unnamed protein product [Blepharisma stoltei]|uniref:Glucokinase n=1 Tax=Blepharisma stoltei TaxID=1481888 RepID=A0AAU9JMB5_9CILI|nr:unnamed protein product [Blepharisma stoltei]
MDLILTADIGGTNARFKLINFSKENIEEKSITYSTKNYLSITDCINDFLENLQKPSIGVIGTAGTIYENTLVTTSTGWRVPISAEEIQQETGINKIVFLNDLVVAGHGIHEITSDQSLTIRDLPISYGKPKVLMSLGTGLGVCYQVWNGSEYLLSPSEGGWVDFSPKKEIDWKFMQFYRRYKDANNLENTGIRVEECIAGKFAQIIYIFLREEFPDLIDPAFDQKFNSDPSKMVATMMHEGFNGTNQLAQLSVRTWARYLGYECGNLIAAFLPFGGLYLYGTLIYTYAEQISKSPDFLEGLFAKDSGLLAIIEKIPISIITAQDLGLAGCNRVARQLNLSI